MLRIISDTMPVSHLVALMAISAFAAWLQGITGFGYALVAVPSVSLVIAPSDAVITVFLDSFFISLIMVSADRQAVQWFDTWRLSVAAIATMPLGVVILVYVSGRSLQLFLAVVTALVAFGGLRHAHRTKPWEIRWWHPWVAGAACGMLTTSISTNGPPLVAYLQRRSMPTHEFRSTLSAVFTITNVAALTVFIVSGLVTTTILTYALAALPAVIVGYLFARRTSPRIHADVFLRMTNILLLLLSALLMWRGLSASS